MFILRRRKKTIILVFKSDQTNAIIQLPLCWTNTYRNIISYFNWTPPVFKIRQMIRIYFRNIRYKNEYFRGTPPARSNIEIKYCTRILLFKSHVWTVNFFFIFLVQSLRGFLFIAAQLINGPMQISCVSCNILNGTLWGNRQPLSTRQ